MKEVEKKQAVSKTVSKAIEKRQFKLKITGRLESNFRTSGTKLIVELHNTKTEQTIFKTYDITNKKETELTFKDNMGMLIGKDWDLKFNVQ